MHQLLVDRTHSGKVAKTDYIGSWRTKAMAMASEVDINRMGIKFDPPINRSSHRLSPAQLLVALLTFVSKKKSTQPRLQVKDHMILAPSAARPDPGWLSITEDIFS
ncbi:hypothetical protein MRB53_015906 [Persea americana]|uniref:Uncharacterized protein n=1 Tax=Persea americana TaxID=3435 RepID=A0ACC2M1Z6_PERAE|nr:hypothetical protein MRB53_015906 [Persea americana]